MPLQAPELTAMDKSWNRLYLIGAGAALATAMFIPLQVLVYIVSPPPNTVLGFYTLFNDNILLGLLALDLLIVLEQVLAIPLYLALLAALWEQGRSYMALATGLGFAGIAAYFASNTAFSMLSLSGQYWAYRSFRSYSCSHGIFWSPAGC